MLTTPQLELRRQLQQEGLTYLLENDDTNLIDRFLSQRVIERLNGWDRVEDVQMIQKPGGLRGVDKPTHVYVSLSLKHNKTSNAHCELESPCLVQLAVIWYLLWP